jgi:hypothetical protein
VNRLRAVAVRVEEERAVVLGAVLGAEARSAVVGVAGLDPRLPERVDVGAGGGDEADVEVPGRRALVRRLPANLPWCSFA